MIVSLDVLNSLVADIYGAAADPSQWPRFIKTLGKTFSSEVTFFLHDLQRRRAECGNVSVSFVQHSCDPAAVAAFERYYCGINIWAERAVHRREGEAFGTDRNIGDRELRKTEFYNDFLKPFGYDYGLTSYILKRGEVAADLAMVRPAGKGSFSEEECKLFQNLVPHLQHACGVVLKSAQSDLVNDTSFAVLDSLAQGAILVDRTGRVCFINKPAEEIMRESKGLSVDREGRLSAPLSAETSRLRNLIQDAVQTGRGLGLMPGGSMPISRPPPHRPLSVNVSPLQSAATPLGELFRDGSPCAIIFLTAPDGSGAMPDENALRALYGLSAAEAAVALMLVRGMAVKEIACARSISVNTVRTQIRSLLSKTDAKNQMQLLSLLLKSTP